MSPLGVFLKNVSFWILLGLLPQVVLAADSDDPFPAGTVVKIMKPFDNSACIDEDEPIENGIPTYSTSDLYFKSGKLGGELHCGSARNQYFDVGGASVCKVTIKQPPLHNVADNKLNPDPWHEVTYVKAQTCKVKSSEVDVDEGEYVLLFDPDCQVISISCVKYSIGKDDVPMNEASAIQDATKNFLSLTSPGENKSLPKSSTLHHAEKGTPPTRSLPEPQVPSTSGSGI